MNKIVAVVPLAGVIALSGGCAHLGSHTAATASQSAAAKAVASSSAAAEGKAIMKQCAPKTPLAQLTWIKNMASKNGDGPPTRAAFASCAGIPPAKTKAFENDALAAAENAGKIAAKSKDITLKDEVKIYLGITPAPDGQETLPGLVVKYRKS